ncbi:periplasmic heavy metal sensor [Asticcacaulis sp. 201]|uniref:periplasmic heavy metal sensor n=1 Tax=Asticcacaulis sp. 201 TaxID=3028787 RepID=UPI0029163269|nr:periplasmic heavy metal sensor [Asticcacaulis sp. 201]MDV6331923.1 periplasmic heavy metal sensor [Asticcacaulis sp. 201]
MKQTHLKWFLAVSVIVNIFLIGAAIGAGVVLKKHMRDFQRPTAMQKDWKDATTGTTEEQRRHIYLLTRDAALSGEPDMAKARALRSQAAALAAKDPYDAAQLAMLSEQARNAENDARSKIENALILNMKELPVRERSFVIRTLLRPSARFNRFVQRDGKPPAEAVADTSASR